MPASFGSGRHSDGARYFGSTRNSTSIALFCLLAGLGSLVLFFLRPTDREFLWFGVWEAFNVLYVLLGIWCNFHSFNVIFWRLGGAILLAGLNGCMPILIRHFGRTDRTRLYWAAIAVALLDSAINVFSLFNGISIFWFCVAEAVMKLLLGASELRSALPNLEGEQGWRCASLLCRWLSIS